MLPPNPAAPPWLLRRTGSRLGQWQEMKRLRRLPRRQAATTTLLGRPLDLVDAPTFLMGIEEILRQELYRFDSRRPNPVILDGGANIGLATLYWKQLYPAARIRAFEPDPTIYQALKRNLCEWGLRDIEAIGAALWTAQGQMSFWSEGSYAGRLVPDPGVSGDSCVTVATVRLRDYLSGPVDLLKLDIEGAETDVLLDCADCLEGVEHLFVQYHSLVGQQQRLDDLLSVLRSAGFRVYLQPHVLLPRPFVTRRIMLGLDQTLNIFARRQRPAGEARTAVGEGISWRSGAAAGDQS
jgi:FkbM family methyltransferase